MKKTHGLKKRIIPCVGNSFFQLDTNLGGTSTVAIIEEETTGEVFSVVPDNVRFTEKEENN